MSKRLVQHYVHSGVIPKPQRKGRFSYYDDQHIATAVQLRQHQKMGLPSQVSKLLHTSSATPDTLSEPVLAADVSSIAPPAHDAAQQALSALAALSSAPSTATKVWPPQAHTKPPGPLPVRQAQAMSSTSEPPTPTPTPLPASTLMPKPNPSMTLVHHTLSHGVQVYLPAHHAWTHDEAVCLTREMLKLLKKE